MSVCRMAQLLRRETSCFDLPLSGFTDLESIPGQGKTMNVPVFCHKVNMVLWTLFSIVKRVIIMHGMYKSYSLASKQC